MRQLVINAVFACILLGAAGLAWRAPVDASLLARSGLYFLPALFLLAASGGLIGRFFGVHNLFRDDSQIFGDAPRRKARRSLRQLASPAFWSGASFAALFNYALAIAYSATPAACAASSPPEACRRLLFQSGGVLPLAEVLLLPKYAPALLIALFVFLGAALLELTSPLATLERRKGPAIRREAARVVVGLATGTLFAWAGYLVASTPHLARLAQALFARLPFADRWQEVDFAWKAIVFAVLVGAMTYGLRQLRGLNTTAYGIELARAIFGVAAGVIIVLGLAGLAASAPTDRLPQGLWWLAWTYSLPVVATFVIRPSLPSVSMAVVGIVLMTVAQIAGPVATNLIGSFANRPLAILFAAAVAGVLLIGINGQRYRYRVPGFEPDYAKAINPQVEGSRSSREPAKQDGAVKRARKMRIAPAGLPDGDAGERASVKSVAAKATERMTGAEALAAWKGKKVVVLCLSGGAYRAAFWSSLVIDELVRRHPGFERLVHLITGASGGMVAGAYLAAMRQNREEPAAPPSAR